MTEQKRARRNLNPTKEAIAAMWLWGKKYSQQSGGSMDFWDGLSDGDKRTCRQMVDEILAAPERSEIR